MGTYLLSLPLYPLYPLYPPEGWMVSSAFLLLGRGALKPRGLLLFFSRKKKSKQKKFAGWLLRS
jgi:hypothetical protein